MTLLNQTTVEGAESKNSAQSRRLYRHPTAGRVGGVCAGLAEGFGWDVTAVRVLWIFLILMSSGAGFLVYLLLWLLLPVGTQSQGRLRPAALDFGGVNGYRAAIVLLGLGAIWLLSNLGLLPDMERLVDLFFGLFFWPLLVIGAGLWLLRQADPHALEGAIRRVRGGLSSLRAQNGEWRQTRTTSATSPVQNGSGPGSSATAHRPLTRSRNDRMLLGVASGMAHWLAIDPVLVRLLWVVGILASAGFGLLLYLVAGLLLPLEPSAPVSESAPSALQDLPSESVESFPSPVETSAEQVVAPDFIENSTIVHL